MENEPGQELPSSSGHSSDIFKLLVSAVQDYAIFALDPKGNIETWNKGAERLKGYSSEEIIGKHFSIFYTPEDLARNHPQNELELAERFEKYEEEGWRVKKDGSLFWASVLITALKAPNGKLLGFAKVTRDLTEKKIIEEARLKEQQNALLIEQFRESERILDQIFSEAPSFMTLLSVPDYRFLKSNEQHKKLIRKDNIIGKTVAEVEPEIVEQGFIKLLDQVVNSGQHYIGKEVEVNYAPVEGEEAKISYLDLVYQPLKNTKGDIYAIAAQGHDVTEKVLSRKAVENERENFRNLFKQTPEMVCILRGPEHIFEFVNDAHIKALGFNATGKSVREAQPESVEVHGILDDVYRTGKTASLHEIPVTVTNKLRYFNLTYAARRDENGIINGIMILGVEVTDQVEARNELQTSRKELEKALLRYSTLTESLPELMWTATAEGKVDYANKRCLDYLGVEPNDIYTQNWVAPIHADDQAMVTTKWQKSFETLTEFNLEYRLRRNDGIYRWFLVRAVPVTNAETVYWIGTASEIEDQKRSIQNLETERKLREQFVLTLSHDLRNPLTAAKTCAQILGRHSVSPEKQTSLTGRIVDSLNRANQMIENLLDANRIKAGEKLQIQMVDVDLNSLVFDTISELSTIHGDRFIVKSNNPLITGYWSLEGIKRIIENLCANAVKYGVEREPITISLEQKEKTVRINVHNLGNPISEDNLKNLFEPFHRINQGQNPSHVKGWGLGLTLVKGLTEAQGGNVSVQSSQKEGTVFTVELPRKL